MKQINQSKMKEKLFNFDHLDQLLNLNNRSKNKENDETRFRDSTLSSNTM